MFAFHPTSGLPPARQEAREQISELIECALDYQQYRDAWAAMAADPARCGDLERLMALMYSDAVQCLDETFKHLKTIKEAQDDAVGASHSDRSKLDEAVRRAERECRGYADMAHTTMAVLAKIARTFPSTFCSAFLVENVASSLLLYVEQLFGAAVRKINVGEECAASCRWSLKEMVRAVLTLFAESCVGSDLFVDAVATAVRSRADAKAMATHLAMQRGDSPAAASPSVTTLELLARALVIVEKHAMLDRVALEQFRQSVSRVTARLGAAAGDADALIDEADAPDEYLDPMSCSLMRDPVRLPNGSVCDRTTIRRHLMSQPTNPFTREPLDESQLVSVPELKAEIEAWLQQQICK